MTDSAQTNVDFLIGMSVFLLAVGFVFGLVPGIFEPFSVDGGSNALVADRGAAILAEGTLGDPGDPSVLNATCTEAFFAGTLHTGCRYDSTDVETALAVPTGTSVNVTIENSGTIRMLGVANTELKAGSTPPAESASVVVARRVVSLDGETSRLIVRVW